ncbi:TetR/AcrR family transcriptional regulator [Amycolatopsis nigrescens]|uniref:TetR/AcrR family transcriptional regulator n=1 Tax=Amycolatopsis nigrescens TaxID=381445 RepID=UPI0003A596E5|nr:TetR/AcrR family transcriptional regulator [Amycolatopsis nigrescens]
MPKQVDHDERRRQLAEALLRLTATKGLEAVSLRHVAAEAGVSMGSVQHYFRTKDEMLLFALQHQAERRESRIRERVLAVSADPSPRTVLRACLVEVLPTDEQSTQEYLVGVAYFIRALAEPSMRESYTNGLPEVIGFFADQIRIAQRAGDADPGADPEREAAILWALSDALGTSILLGQLPPAESVSTVDYYLDRLFSPGPPRT